MNAPEEQRTMALITCSREELEEPQLAPEAVDTQRFFIAKAEAIVSCTNAEEAAKLAEAARALATHLKEVDEIELSLRRPKNTWLDTLRKIKNAYSDPLIQHKARLERLHEDFTAAERRRVQEAERVRQAEIQRLENERRLAEAKAREEAERVARENREAEERARAREAKIKTDAQMQAAMRAEEKRKAEAAARQAEADALAEKARQASVAAQAAIRQPLPAVHKTAGLTTKREMAWEVTDIKALVKARPELCNIEAKASAIRAVCLPALPKDSDDVDTTSVPGLALRWVDSTSTRKW